MFSRFFIDRPIFAAVLSIVIVLLGSVALLSLPLAQFPRVSPPNVSVSCTFPGASAQDVAEAVAAPIEQQVNGVEGMMYMSSTCTNDGAYNLSVTFHQGIDLNMAQVLVQNRVALAMPQLPDVIKQTGVTVRKRSQDPLIGFALVSRDGHYDQLYLSNYMIRFLKDEVLRVPGVADAYLMAQRDYSVRIWVNPYRLAARGLTASDLVRALREQNNEVAAGQIGQQPLADGQDFQITLDLLGRLQTVEQFEDIILRSMPDGRVVKLKDVARVELGAKNQDVATRFDRLPAASMIVFQLPQANALETRDRLVKRIKELSQNFPQGISCEISFDTTPYTRESINEVFKTLRDAVILVAVVVLLFLQSWRSALIPLAAVPVAIIGTLAVMAPLGFSLNTLTLFGLVLAIGIVVDDAIVVVEAVEHHIDEGLSPREATIQAMQEVSGPVIAVGLVLTAVFVPCAFIAGITGAFFRQFALTIAVSTLISAFNSLTLSPALTAWLLRPRLAALTQPGSLGSPLPCLGVAVALAWLGYEHGERLLADLVPAEWTRWVGAGVAFGLGLLLSGPINRLLAWWFGWFNRGFAHLTNWYVTGVDHLLRASVIALLVYTGLLGVTGLAYLTTPRGFIPSGDMGYLLVSVQLPDSASLERTEEVMRKLEDIVHATPGVVHSTAIAGQSFALNAAGSNFGSMFVRLDDFAKRRDPALHGEVIASKLRTVFAEKIHDATVAVFGPPPVRGAGRAGGWAFVLEDRGDLGPRALQEQVENLVRVAHQEPGLVGVFAVFRANVPQLKIEPDVRECETRGVSLGEFASTLRVFEGSLYVNDINLFGRTWQVIVQADSSFRDQVEDLYRLKSRNLKGQMVPLGSVASIREVNGPLVLTRYNMYPSATINGYAAPGVSSMQAIELMQKLAARELPASMAYEWTDLSYLELLAANTGAVLFIFAVAMVFLVLAAQFESWSLPLAVILVVPLCVLSAIAGVLIMGKDINIFTQIGFVVLVGLASKNAVLIVEFARSLRQQGLSRREAALRACRLRLRPIIMTSLAFILGVLPLVLAQGAGAEMRQALGAAVFFGMAGVTLFGIFLTPVFFTSIDWLGERRMFATGLLHQVGHQVLDVLHLGPVWRLLRWWRQSKET